MGRVATTGGITAEDVRERMVATVEHSFGPVTRLAKPIECLADNGSPYIAGDTRRFTRERRGRLAFVVRASSGA